MIELLRVLIEGLLTDGLQFMDFALQNMVPTAFYAEKALDGMLGFNVLSSLYEILFAFGVSLIILKFVKKGFDTYVLWIDGDADADPLVYLTYFLKALIVAISFPTLYDWMATLVQKLTDKLLVAVNSGVNVDFMMLIAYLVTGGIVAAIIGLVYFICYVFLYIKFLQTGVEILILRLGIPIAAVGLVDSDGGVFKTYMQKFFQTMITVIVQVVLLKLSLALMMNGHLIWGTAFILAAIRTPKFLQEFIIIPGGSGGVLGKAYQATRLVQLLTRR